MEGWTTDPGRDSQLEYRLSIMSAEKEDSGIYRCETPARQSHQVEIIVEGMFLLSKDDIYDDYLLDYGLYYFSYDPSYLSA